MLGQLGLLLALLALCAVGARLLARRAPSASPALVLSLRKMARSDGMATVELEVYPDGSYHAHYGVRTLLGGEHSVEENGIISRAEQAQLSEFRPIRGARSGYWGQLQVGTSKWRLSWLDAKRLIPTWVGTVFRRLKKHCRGEPYQERTREGL